MTLDVTLITTLVTSLTAIAVGFLSYLKIREERLKSNQATRELTLQQAAFDFTGFMSQMNGFHQELMNMMETTDIDRFLILRAWNGKLNPRWTTAIFQIRQGSQDPVSYVHFELDHDYVDRLRTLVNGGDVVFRTDELPDCAIKRVYMAEGVTASRWFLIETKESDKNSRSITYCSFATHKPQGISEELGTRCKVLSGRLLGMASSFMEQ